MELESTAIKTVENLNPSDQYFNWSEIDEHDGDREILLNDFKQDLKHLNDLEEGMLGQQAPKKIAAPPRMTRDDKAKARSQPKRHASSKSIFETAFGPCCVVDHDLNKRESKYYNKFMKTMVGDYDKDNTEHERILQEFYAKVFGREPDLEVKNSSGATMVEDEWKDIGFQGKDPRTDFRGGGHLSLLCLLYMVDNYRSDWDKLATATKD